MNQNYITYEQALALIQAQNRPSNGWLADAVTIVRDVVGQTGIDGSITLGDVVKAGGVVTFYSVVTPVATTGASLILDLAVNVSILDFTQFGLGAGTLLGAILAGERLARDYRYVPVIAEAAPESDDPGQLGLNLMVREGSTDTFVVLLPTVKRALIKDMVHTTSRAYFQPGFSDGAKKNFSKRRLGKPWGEHLGAARVTLLRCGYLREAKNNTTVFTRSGREWLADYY